LYGAPATVYCDSVTLIFASIIIIIILIVMVKISRLDKVTDEEAFRRVNEDRQILNSI